MDLATLNTAGAGQLAGDDLDAMIRRYAPLVRAVAWKVAPVAPPGITIESLIVAGTDGLVQAMRTHRPARGSLTDWMAQKARFAMIEYVRTEGRVLRRAQQLPERRCRETDGDQLNDGEAVPDHRQADPGEIAEKRELAAKLLRGLAPDDRALARLRLAGGCSPRAAAAVLGCSTSTIHNRERRLLARLRDRALRLTA